MLDFEFDPKDCVFVRIDRRRKLPATIILRVLGCTDEEMLGMFFDVNVFHVKKKGFSLDLEPERLLGEVLSFDIVTRNGELIVEAGNRVTKRHVNLLLKSRNKRLDVPRDYLIDRVTAEDIVDAGTGEIILPCNSIISEEVLDKLLNLEVSTIKTIHTNELDCGPFISDTLRIDTTSNRLEALVENLPHDAPRRAAHQGGGGEPVRQPVLLQGALRPFRRRAHEIQPAFGAG